MTSVVDAPRLVSSDASPTRPECAVIRRSTPAAAAAAVNRSPVICGDSGTTRSPGSGFVARHRSACPAAHRFRGPHRPHLRVVGGVRRAGLRGFRDAGRRHPLRQGLRHRQPRVRRTDHAGERLPRRLRLQAVHRHGGGAAGGRGPRLVGRRRPPPRAGASGLRRADHAPPPGAAHERDPRPVEPAADGGLALGRRRHHAGRRARSARAADGAPLPARNRAPLQQLRLHPARRRGRTGVGAVAPRVHRRPRVRAARG